MKLVADNKVQRDRLSRLGLLEEPMGYVDGMSLYEYVKSDPLSTVDPLGRASIKMGGETWEFPRVGDHPDGDVVDGVNIGRHLHLRDNPNVKFYPKAGKIRRADGTLCDAPGKLKSDWAKKINDPKIQKRMLGVGILGLLTVLSFAVSDASGETQERVDRIKKDFQIMMGNRQRADKELAAAEIADDVQHIFQSDVAGTLTLNKLLEALDNPGQPEKDFDALSID